MGVKIADDFPVDQPPPEPPIGSEPQPNPEIRHLKLTPASAIKPRRVRWLWKDRIAYGTLSLLAGREGLGKSTLGYKLAADVTKGTLEGEDYGNPRAVLVCATEDSWEHTIVPRLIAAQADLDIVYRVEMAYAFDDMRVALTLPRDFAAARAAAEDTSAGLMILDPLMSVIDAKLDTHRDREVRQALEPLAGLADDARMAILGLIHHNKSGSTDALQLVMGSKAFSAVARSVHTCIPDPDDEDQVRKLFATSKNNLGRLDLPVLGFTITSHAVETEDDGTAWTGRLHWTGEVEGSMHELMTRSADPERGAAAEAAQWLEDYLTQHGGELPKVDIEKAGRAAGHAPRTLQRARERLRLTVSSYGFPRRTHWAIAGTQPDPEAARDVTEPLHPRPDDQAEVGTTADPSGADRSRANYTDQPLPLDSRAKSRQDMAPLGTTGSDLQKQETDPPPAPPRAHIGGDTHLAQLDGMAQQQPPVVPSSPVVPSPPRRARARDDSETASTRAPVPDTDQPAPLCDDCGWALDTNQHATTCEEQP
jgi:hypothetical protein